MRSFGSRTVHGSYEARPALSKPRFQSLHAREAAHPRNRASIEPRKAVAAPEERKTEPKQNEGHSALLQGLGEVGDVPTVHVPWLLRLAHIR